MARKLQKNRQMQSIYEEFFWSKNEMYGELCTTYY